jgi:phosphate-selective porin OprO/OprP
VACLFMTASFPATAQTMSRQEAAALRAEVAALKAQVNRLEARLDAASRPAVNAPLAGDLPAPAGSKPAESAPGALAQSRPIPVAPSPDFKIAWKGAPEITAPGGWSFKPRGRLQFDSGFLFTPPLSGTGAINASTGLSTELRRAYLGAQGTIPGGFGYRFDVDFAPTSQEFTDTYLTWGHVWGRKSLNVTLGQHFPFLSLDQMTSDLDTSFLERAAFNTAFNFERRVGLSLGYASGDLLVNAGVFTDNLTDLSSDADNSHSFDGRLVWMPLFGKVQIHLAGSAHWRDQEDQSVVPVRYRSRPLTHTTDLRFVDTLALNVARELNYGVEAAAIAGPLHFAAEANWLRPTLASGAKPTLCGGYAELGYFLTRGDTRPYRRSNATWGAIKPARGIDQGGPGAIQVNLRYDRLDLSDGIVTGGTQDSYLASMIWTPVEHLRLMANYGHLFFNGAAIATGTDRDYAADILVMRGQVDF